jgi:hypothetical protein
VAVGSDIPSFASSPATPATPDVAPKKAAVKAVPQTASVANSSSAKGDIDFNDFEKF